MKAVAYIRVSTDRQEISPEAQADKIRHFAALNDFDVEIVIDLDTSGRLKFEDRELGRRALELLESADAIIFHKLARAFRNAADTLTLVPKLLKAGKDVLFMDIGVSVRTPTGKMIMGMLAVQAEWEVDIISERIKDALHEVKRQGRKIGPAGFGFRNRAHVVDGRKVDAGLHEPVASEAAALSLITSMRGRPLREIAAALIAAKVPTRRGGRWSGEHVRKILARSAE